MAVIGRPFPSINLNRNASPLRVTGFVLIVFSGILGPIVLLSPIGCTVVGAIQVLIFGFMFLLGVGIFIASFLHKKNK